MNLQTQVSVNSEQREYFNIMESGFPYLTIFGVLEIHGVHKKTSDYLDRYLMDNTEVLKGNFRFSIMETVPWHWHEELEFCSIIKGCCRFCLPDQEFILNEGDAVFVNTNSLHMAEKIHNDIEVIYHTQQFRKELLEGAEGSVFGDKYIKPLLENSNIQGIIFRKADKKQEEMIYLMEQAYQYYLHSGEGYEMKIRNFISEFWLYILREYKEKIGFYEKSQDIVNERIKTMLTFIEYNYMDKISVEAIGASANVSKRECLRSFKANLHTSPFAYITDFRIRKAAEMLAETDDSIITVSEACGFSSNSYFGKVFHKVMGCTPKEYRKK